MDEQSNNQLPQQTPPANPGNPPQPIQPGYAGQPMAPAPDPRLYQAPTTPISSQAPKSPIWLFIVIGISFAAAVGLLVAVFVLM